MMCNATMTGGSTIRLRGLHQASHTTAEAKMTLPRVVSSRMPLELRIAWRQLPPVEARDDGGHRDGR